MSLTGSLAGCVLAEHPCGDIVVEGGGLRLARRWRAHGPWCVGPSTLELTEANLDGKRLAPAAEFLTCALRFCEDRERLIALVERDPRDLWTLILYADSRPRAAEPVGPRARYEADPPPCPTCGRR
jgi:hypothetical protein